MSTSQTSLDLLIEEQHATLQLLQAMYPLPSELALSPDAQSFLDDPSATSNLANVTFDLNINADDQEISSGSFSLNIRLNLSTGDHKAVVSLSTSTLPRAEHEALRAEIYPIEVNATTSDYILDLISHLRETATTLASRVNEAEDAPEKAVMVKEEKLERVWFWFPSLSSRDKRKDLVTFAHDAGLTGFVLAGKPGLLCVEGDGTDVDGYMGRIKSESWSDIPSYQKKVTERLRLPLSPPESPRLLPWMTDITDQISHYGQYAHRPEMGEVKKQMQIWGVEEEWSKVVMSGIGGGGG